MGMDINGLSYQGVPAKSIGAGVKPQVSIDQIGGLLISEFMPQYSNLAYYGKIFTAANPTGVTSTAFVSGTTTVFLGFCLSNPVGSLVNLHLLNVGYACAIPPASVAPVVLARGFNAATSVTHTAPIAPLNANFAFGAGTGLVDSSFTVPTAPVTTQILGQITTVASNGSPNLQDLRGSTLIPPGGYIIIASTVASGASGAFASAQWAELPL